MTEIGDYLTVIYQLEPPAETGCVNFFSSSRPADHNIDHFECDISYRGREPAFDLEMATAKSMWYLPTSVRHLNLTITRRSRTRDLLTSSTHPGYISSPYGDIRHS